MGLGRETCHTADRPDDLGGQYGTHAKDIGEGGVASFYLGFDVSIELCDLSLQCPDVAHDLRSQPPATAGPEEPCGRMPRRMRAARRVESVPGTPPGTRSRRSPCRRLNARVRSATKSPRLSETVAGPPPPGLGIDSDQDLLMRCTHLRFGWISAIVACVKDTPTLGRALIPLLSHSAPRSPAGREPRTGQPPAQEGRQALRERPYAGALEA